MEPQSKNWMIGIAVVLLVVGALAWYLNRGYGKVSGEGYQYAMALMSACNRSDEARVRAIVERIDGAVLSGEVPEEDAEALRGIADVALEGDWETAASAIRRLMEAQVEAAGG